MLWTLGLAVPARELPEKDPTTIPVDRAEDTGPAPAKEMATVLEPIEVTGSRIRRTDYETVQPILVLTREDIDRTGLTSIGDILQNLAIAGSSQQNTQFGFGGTGGVNVDLRHLGSFRVLVLVNGHRWINGAFFFNTGAADFTTIPISVIERVEVLKDSASAIYGSDAITGVINIITRKDYQGAEFQTHAGLYDAGDGLTQAHNLSFGKVTAATSAFVDVSFARQNEIFNGDREFTEFAVPGSGNSRGSFQTPQGHYQFVPTPATESALAAADPGGDPCPGTLGVQVPGFRPVNPAPWCDITTTPGSSGDDPTSFRHFDYAQDPYNVAPLLHLLTPNERSAVFGQLAYRLTDALHVTSELLYNRRRSRQQITPYPLVIGDLFGFRPESTVFVAATNMFNPFAQDIGLGAGGTDNVGSGIVARRLIEQGPRAFSQDVDTFRGAVALNGPLELDAVGIDRLVNWELGYSHAQSRQKETEEGMFNVEHLRLAVGPDADCTNECVPLNLFSGQGPDGRGTITREMLDYIEHTGHNSTRVRALDAFANFRTELVQLAAGPVPMAFGFEIREEDYSHYPDPLVLFGNGYSVRPPTVGGYSAAEAYAEFGVPVVSGVPFAETLDVSLAGRYSDYARFGVSETGKVGLRWKPFQDLLVRGTWGTAFRTPNVTELFLGAADLVTGPVDPCRSATGSGDPNTDANCQADGATPVYDVVTFLTVFRGGNPELKPEAAETRSAGLVYSPGFLPDLNLYLDWYHISVKDFILNPGPQFILDACYKARPDQRAFCDQVHRNPDDDRIEYINDTFLNLPRLETEGLDLSFDYRLPALGDLGTLRILADFAYLSELNLYTPTVGLFSREAVSGEAKTSAAGKFLSAFIAAFPRWKGNVALDWSEGLWNASWTTRYIHHMRERCVDGRTPSLRDLGLCSDPDPVVVTVNDPAIPGDERDPDDSENVLKATFYHDLQIGYQLADWDTKLSVGVNNLLNQDPPRIYSIVGPQAYSYDPTTYDVPGRFLYLRLQQSF